LVAGLLTAANAPAAGPIDEEIEADWLRQAAAKVQGAASPVTPQSDAGGAVDGVKNGRWGFHTSQDADPWWQVDLGEAVALGRVLVFNSCHVADRASRLRVLLSTDGASWHEAYAHDGTVFGGQPDGKPLAAALGGASARFVRIQLPGPQWLHLDEVEVYGQADPAGNLALGRPADQSSTSQWSTASLPVLLDPAVPYPIEETLLRGRKLIDERRRAGMAVERFERALEAVAAEAEALADESDPDARRSLFIEARRAVRQLVLSDPLAAFDKLLFVKRFTYQSSHIYTDHFDGSTLTGGNLCVLSPVAPEGKVTEIVPALSGGIFGRFDLSYDAKRVVFAYKTPGKGYRIYEVGVDGAGLRQLTHDAPDEADALRRFNHGYDDMDPCYLPDGRIMFVSTRSRRAVLCHNAFTTTSLYTIDADGGDLRCASGNTVNEFTPCMMDDGRVIYTRWEYVDKGCGDVQSLWSVRPDGSGAAHVFKNNVSRPATLIDARSVPNSNRIVAVGAPHMPLAVGSVVLIDTRVTQRGSEAMTNLTPELGYPGHSGYPAGQLGYYKEPFPLSEELFLVSYNPGPKHNEPAGYGIYLLDASGNRELVYRDPDISCFQPMPLRPRSRHAPLPGAGALAHDEPRQTATLFMADVYRGLTGIERGRVKYVRVMEDVPKPWQASWDSPRQGDSMGLQNPAVSLAGHFTVKKVYGVVPVEADGSAHFRVPAAKNLYFQALDENYMELQRMRTFVNLVPGERRSCIGCHELRKHAPGLKPAGPMALDHPIHDPIPQPGDTGPRMVHYAVDVQPIFDKHCVGCHGDREPRGDLDLTGEPTTLFSRSYENLITRKLVNNIDVNPRDAYIPAEPPLTFGSHRSKLLEMIRSGPCEANLSQAEFVRLVTWIDANAPYYGVYEGKKNVKWQGSPDFRPNPPLAARGP
jgi:hypothetical protein